MSDRSLNQDLAGVEKTVRTYLDGLYEGDTEKLASARRDARA